MVWVRTPDDLYDQPDVLAIGLDAVAVHHAALGYSNRNLTDGLVPHAKASTLLAVADLAGIIARLVAAGWWAERPGGYQLVFLLDLQPCAASVRAKRAATAQRTAAYRARRDVAGDSVTDTPSTPLPVNPDPVPGPVNPDPDHHPSSNGSMRELRTSADVRQHGSALRRADVAPLRGTTSPSAPRTKKQTATQVKLAEIVDLVRAAGIPIHPTSRDGGVLKSCAAPPGLIAEAYVAAARGEWDPGGDRFLPSNLSLHMVIDRLAGYQVERSPPARSYLDGYGLLMRGAGHNVHGPGCDCPPGAPTPAF